MDALKILLALHDPGRAPDLEAELRARGLFVTTTHNQADTWNRVREQRPDAVLLMPVARTSDAAELSSLLTLSGTAGGPALLVLTDQPALLETRAGQVDDFLHPDDPVDLIARRLRFSVARRRSLAGLLREREDLLRETSTDFKTGLSNDRHFTERCRIESARAAREGRPLGVLMLDLDEFKSLNDQHDHPFGDYVLRRLADVLRQDLRPFDTAARLGGDEFGVLLPNSTVDVVTKIAERLRATVAALPLDHGGHRARATITVGAASWDPAGTESFEDIVRGADQALLAAKRQGRNRVALYAGGDEDSVPDDLEIEPEEPEPEATEADATAEPAPAAKKKAKKRRTRAPK